MVPVPNIAIAGRQLLARSERPTPPGGSNLPADPAATTPRRPAPFTSVRCLFCRDHANSNARNGHSSRAHLAVAATPAAPCPAAPRARWTWAACVLLLVFVSAWLRSHLHKDSLSLRVFSKLFVYELWLRMYGRSSLAVSSRSWSSAPDLEKLAVLAPARESDAEHDLY
jgi:hypothetical protein